MSLITCSNLSFSYENQTVVSSLNFQVNEGDYLCIVGENGTGKTTLIRGLLGLKKPSGGQLLFGDGLKSTQIGYVPQQDAVQKDFPASVYEVVLSGCLNSRGLLPGYSAASASGSFLPVPCARRNACFCWMSPPPDWIPLPSMSFMS